MGLGTIKNFLLIFGSIYLVIGRGFGSSELAFGNERISFVLVNEDTGATFNGVDYHFGSDFVLLVNQDTQNRWQTTSRSVAEAGLNSGNFDVLVLLPQNFSTNLLSLESLAPEQAMITYEIRMGNDELTNLLITTQVNQVLADFERRIVQMYFSSILENLQTAQANVGAMIGNEQRRHAFFVDHVQAPFTDIPVVLFENIDDALFLAMETYGWQGQRLAFNDWVDEFLTNAGTRLISQQDQLTVYAEFMEQLAMANKLNAEFVLAEQSELDGEFYYEQYEFFYQNTLEQLAEYEDLLGEFEQKVAEFSEEQEKLKLVLADEIEIANRLGDLLEQLELELANLVELQETVGRYMNRDKIEMILTHLFAIEQECECDFEDDEIIEQYDNEITDENDDVSWDEDACECECNDDTQFIIFSNIADFLAGIITDLYEEVGNQYDVLSAIIATKNDYVATSQLNDILELVPEPELFSPIVAEFTGWHEGAIVAATTTYDLFAFAEPLTLDLVHHRGEFDFLNPSATFYFDKIYHAEIMADSQRLVSSIEHDLDLIMYRDAEMADLTNEFTSMVNRVESAHDLTDSLMMGMGDFSTEIDTHVATNSNFAQNFGQVMANTRVGGRENTAVVQFLATPIALSGSYKGRESIIHETHFRTMGTMSFVVIGVISVGSKFLLSRKKDGVLEHE